ncbi:MAG: hypothetical protein J0M04_16365 [Verrucomicrobia bacterium]|nr:hypothetical protein [Verrucomicrobiota bacterium]
MKMFLNLPLLLAAGLLPALAVSPARERPAFLPNTPPADKPIAEYTPMDVLGIVATRSDLLPKIHLYRAGGRSSGLKANWPGAKVATSVDAMLQVIINAEPAPDDDPWNRWDALENVRFVLKNVMVLTDAEKADAFIRVVDAQTDPKKKAFAKSIAASMWETFLDPRLLLYAKANLDNATIIHGARMAEGVPNVYTVRSQALRSLETCLADIDLPPDPAWKQLDEAAHCAALKQWMTDNWTLIAQKCAETKAKPDWKRPVPSIVPFDARW